MESSGQEYWRRSNGVLIYRQPADVLERFNDANREITHRARGAQRFTTPIPMITDAFTVLDVERKQCHTVLVHRMDCRSGLQSIVGKVAKFSKGCYAPFRAKEIQLATPSYYRDQEKLPRGIADPHDSTLTRNATPWMRSRIPYGSVEAEVVLSSSSDPWVYCVSHLQSHRVTRKLRSTFSEKYDYDAVTEIKDANTFAMWLGVDFALQIDKDEHLKLDALDSLGYLLTSYCIGLAQHQGLRNIDTVVHIYHGPVHYEDESGVIKTQDDWADIHGAPRAWFTKRMEFAYQNEYRFAISTAGSPTKDIFRLEVSDDLRQYTLEI